MPWTPELFRAPALEQLLRKRRRDKLLALPYFGGLMAGEPDALVESFAGSASDLTSALQRAAAAHGEHEKRIGEADPNWPDSFAEYRVRERARSLVSDGDVIHFRGGDPAPAALSDAEGVRANW